MKKVIIIGGGLSGLVTAIRLAKSGVGCTLLEKRNYPLHRVCGEYISNETVPFLKANGLYPAEFIPAEINRLQLTSVNGRSAFLNLGLGGFGISRYKFDQFLYQKALAAGVNIKVNTEAEKIVFQEDHFIVQAGGAALEADLVIGAFGKRSKIDISMDRSFIRKRSPYLGVKYHIRTDQPSDLISLHNFENGYCGISNVEEGIVNLCYLSHRNNLKVAGTIRKMEESVLFRNPYIKAIFDRAEFLFDKPETINEISFETKAPVEAHVLMTGDSAGMITPLCGNGMAIAIHSAHILSRLVTRFCSTDNYSRSGLEHDYTRAWSTAFKRRLWTGRQVQRLFGSVWASDFAVSLATRSTPLASWLVSKTHGKEFS